MIINWTPSIESIREVQNLENEINQLETNWINGLISEKEYDIELDIIIAAQNKIIEDRRI